LIEGRFAAGNGTDVSFVLQESDPSNALLVLAHGAGADMRHASMASIAQALADRGIATLRFNFPYMEAGNRRVDSRPVATQSIANAVAFAQQQRPTLPLFLGGHSFGGRMASHAVLEHDLAAVRGLVFCSFPLHLADKPDTARAAHLPEIRQPLLFVSGTRDALAERSLLQGVVAKLGATLVWLETANHGYRVQKRSRQRTDSVFDELGAAVEGFVTSLC
jgi:predicted alpha/beta-hydrolase family hydrolase